MAGIAPIMSDVMLLTSPSKRFIKSPLWCFCMYCHSLRMRREKILSLMLLAAFTPCMEFIQRLQLRSMISDSITSPITQPVVAMLPLALPVAMSIACLHARTHSN